MTLTLRHYLVCTLNGRHSVHALLYTSVIYECELAEASDFYSRQSHNVL